MRERFKNERRRLWAKLGGISLTLSCAVGVAKDEKEDGKMMQNNTKSQEEMSQ